jgi:hypothetical protein
MQRSTIKKNGWEWEDRSSGDYKENKMDMMNMYG